MPLELQIIRASEFIRLGARGQIDLSASREILRQLAGACRRRGIDQALLDLRDVHPGATPMLTREDLAALVNTFREVGFSRQQRLAVLYTSDPHHRARLFAFMTTLHGWNVKASDSFEEALLWLSHGAKAEGRKKAGKQKVPVRATGTAGDLPGRTLLRAGAGKANKPRAPDRLRPPSGASLKVSMKRTQKAERL